MRTRAALVAGLLLIVAVSASGCSGSSKAKATCAEGAEGCACFVNDTCLGGLTCASKLCVNLGGVGGQPSVGGAGGSAGTVSTGGGGGAVMGGAGTTGAAGTNASGGTTSAGGGTAGGGEPANTGGTNVGGSTGTGGVAGTTGAGGMSAGGSNGTGGAAGASGAGGTSAGGSPGTGGALGCGGLIDDFEANTGYICRDNGRVGYWFSYKDTASTFFPVGTPSLPSPLPVPRGTSQRALHTYGTTVQYAGLGCLINNVPALTYNASAYTGIRFYVMGTAAAPTVIVQTRSTESTTYGGNCPLPTLTCAGNSAAITGLQPSAWTLVTVPFSSLTGGTAPFSATEVWSVEFQGGVGAFDLWIDDLTFY